MDKLEAVLAIVLIDLALSGDNALVIGMAARGLPRRQRRLAIVLGGAGAVALRVTAAAVVTVLLTIPYLQLIAGLALVAIAYRLVRPVSSQGSEVRVATTLREAIITILLADAAMSTENILGVAAAAHGDIGLLAFGLALSIPIVLFGSGLVVAILDRVPSAIWLGAGALVWTAAAMILDEPALQLRPTLPWASEAVLATTLFAVIFLTRYAGRLRAR